MEKKYTEDKYIELGFTVLADGRVKDKNGNIISPRKSQSPLKAIRAFCLECMGMDRRSFNSPKPIDDVANCPDPCCPVFDFRYGKNPFITRSLTDEQREAARERVKVIRGA